MKKTRLIFAATGTLIIAAAGAACSASNNDEIEAAATQAQLTNLLDVNDVSILFPIKDGQLAPNINVDDKLWKQSNFDELMAQATIEGINQLTTADVLTKRAIYHPV